YGTTAVCKYLSPLSHLSVTATDRANSPVSLVTNFIQQPLPQGSTTGAGFGGQSGALGLGQRASNGLGTFNTFWVYVIPLFGAYIADTYWGRYKPISVSLAICLVGHVLLVISAIRPVIVHPNG